MRAATRKAQVRRMAAGAAGERRVARALAAAGFEAINDFVFVDRGVSRQVDHLVRCRDTLVCLETKNWAGSIRGWDRGEWQVDRPGGRKSRAHDNPLDQNLEHVAGVARLTGVRVEGLVVMAGSARHVSGRFPDGVARIGDAVELLRQAGADGGCGRQVDDAWRALRRESGAKAMDGLRFRHARSTAGRVPAPWLDWWALASMVAAAACAWDSPSAPLAWLRGIFG